MDKSASFSVTETTRLGPQYEGIAVEKLTADSYIKQTTTPRVKTGNFGVNKESNVN
jgi:hypothetical protein